MVGVASHAGRARPSPRQYFVYINNSSDSPIFVEKMRAVQKHEDGPSGTVEVVWGTVPAQAVEDYGVEESIFDMNLDPPLIEITYSDVDGVRWFRNSLGTIRRIGLEAIEQG